MSSHKFNDISVAIVASCYFISCKSYHHLPLHLLMLFLLKDVEDWILPLFARIQTTKVVIHKRFNCLMYVINNAFQLVIFIGINLFGGINNNNKMERAIRIKTVIWLWWYLTWCLNITPFWINDFVRSMVCCWCTQVSAVPWINK